MDADDSDTDNDTMSTRVSECVLCCKPTTHVLNECLQHVCTECGATQPGREIHGDKTYEVEPLIGLNPDTVVSLRSTLTEEQERRFRVREHCSWDRKRDNPATHRKRTAEIMDVIEKLLNLVNRIQVFRTWTDRCREMAGT